ncbi:protein takeout [Hetaerina americana]|uniref:protein takeout n=1 Tax=Hetaerina americana TaxID=62018 RepID=UPI003A7F3E8A
MCECNRLTIIALLVAIIGTCLVQSDTPPYYVLQCSKSDPKLNECLTRSGNHLAEHFRGGIPELGITEVEPVLIDEVSIALGSGPDGYKASFRDIEARGVSNMTLVKMIADVDKLEMQMALKIPKIRAKANYRSSGVLLVVKASGGGDYWGIYDGVRVVVDFVGSRYVGADGKTYAKVKSVKLDFTVDKIRMGIEKLHNGNQVIEAAMNLFINTNAQELMMEMKPTLKKKFEAILTNFLESKVLSKIPLEVFFTD